MHELSTVIRIVNTALSALEHETRRPKAVSVGIGEMTDILPEYVRKYYIEAVKDTVLEGTQLHIEMIPAKAHCDGCGNDFHPCRENDYLCPECKGSVCHITEGRTTRLINIELEDKDGHY